MVRYTSEVNDLFHYLLEAKKCHNLKKISRGESISKLSQCVQVFCEGAISAAFYWSVDAHQWNTVDIYISNRGLIGGALRRMFFFKPGITAKEIVVLLEEIVDAVYNSVGGVVQISHRYFSESIPEF